MAGLVLALLAGPALLPAPAWAQPTVANTSAGGDSTAGTSHIMDLPTGHQSGDLVVLCADARSDVITFPAGWTNELFTTAGGGGTNRIHGRYRVLDGSEGSSITATTAGSVKNAYVMFLIRSYQGTPEGAGAGSASADGAPDPPQVTPSWGSANTLWVVCESHRDASVTVTAYPTNYDSNQVSGGSSAGSSVRVSGATRAATASSENPGTFTLSSAIGWAAGTIAVRPAATSACPGRLMMTGIGGC